MVRQYKSEEKPLAIEMTHPFKKRWGIRWNFEQRDEMWYYVEKEFSTKPSLELIKTTILDWYNQQADKRILSGFVWKDNPVWLSSENQFNYKASYDLAAMTGGESLKDPDNPVVFKFGTDDEPVYYTFTEFDDIQDFYLNSVKHISQTLKKCWEAKGSINWKDYEV